ncbi:hypothetical protein LSTR_LSTR010292 [Laodelphax striatellus]|uniref:Uncharacterized protein n=1 Tax=Laodelphax striatellus TaxID=195883 RepID=A0A482XS93_LAOST|nr:hypothetical protein LSTR_LSTR010292 [Laodelphax striatellus]
MITMDAVRVAWTLSLFVRVFGLEQEAASTWSSPRQGRPASFTDLNNRRAFKFLPGERRISSEISFQNVANDHFGVHPRRRIHNYTKLSMVPTEKIITSSVFLDHSTQIPSHLANVFTPNPLAVTNNDYDDDQQLIYVSSSSPTQDSVVATPHPYVSTSVVKYHPSTISPPSPSSSTVKPPVKNLVKETRKEDSEEEDEDEDEEDDDDEDDDDDDDDDDEDEEEEEDSEETHDTSIKDSEEDLATDETKDDDSGYDDGSYSPKKKKGKKKKKKGGKKKKKKGQFKMKHLKKLKKYMFPLLLAYKLKFFTLIPLMLGGLVLIVGTTGFAGFFFALFAIGLSLQKH